MNWWKFGSSPSCPMPSAEDDRRSSAHEGFRNPPAGRIQHGGCMKKRIAIVSLVAGLLCAVHPNPATAQGAEDEVKAVVDALFDAMRAADSAAVRMLFHPEMEKMASSGERDGVAGVGFGDIEGFIRTVGGSTPGAFDEKIGPAEIRMDDNLATVFTPYAFHYNGNLSHCGVNVFLIARVGDDWQIVGLADTRRRQGCEEWLK